MSQQKDHKQKLKHLIDAEEINNQTKGSSFHTFKRIKEYVEDVSKTSVITFGVSYDIWMSLSNNFINEKGEVKDEDMEVLIKLSEFDPDYDLYYDFDNKEAHVSPEMEDVIMYHKKFDVYVVIPRYFKPSEDDGELVLLTDDIEKAKDFTKHVKEMSMRRTDDEILVIKDTSKGPIVSFEEIKRDVKKEDVIIESGIKEEIYKSIDAFFDDGDDNFFIKNNIPRKRGILLYGDPGNGKTTLIKSLSTEINFPVIYWQVSEFSSSASIGMVFEEASNNAPCLLVIEDIDSLPESARSTFLNTLDGAAGQEGYFLVGTTNYPDRVDSSLKNRTGRFDRTFQLEKPDEKMREAYVRNRGFNNVLSENEVIELIDMTDDFSFAQLNEVYITLLLNEHVDKQSGFRDIVNHLKELNEKDQKGNWDNESKGSGVGFINR